MYLFLKNVNKSSYKVILFSNLLNVVDNIFKMKKLSRSLLLWYLDFIICYLNGKTC